MLMSSRHARIFDNSAISNVYRMTITDVSLSAVSKIPGKLLYSDTTVDFFCHEVASSSLLRNSDINPQYLATSCFTLERFTPCACLYFDTNTNYG